MSLTRQDFVAFFAAVHGGHVPFDWQQRLLDVVLDTGRWPERLVAPTGSGKTAVIDVHVFAQALQAAGDSHRAPRRLAMVVDRRVLVDDQYEHATDLARMLESPEDPVLQEVAERLWRLRRPRGGGLRPEKESPLVVGRLRGAVPSHRGWRDEPTAAAVLCATVDMWGSRALFGGYGSSRLAWPREAGLLTVDAAVVIDEAHLARQLVHTARRVAELVPVAETMPHAVPLQVVEVTATPAGDPSATTVDVTDTDLANETLRARLTRPKPVAIREVEGWSSASGKGAATAVTALVDAVLRHVGDVDAETGPSTIGCFVNSVARATRVAAEIQRRGDLRVVLVCGQLRPHDLSALQNRYPGLLSINGSTEVDVLVSTQSLEAGVDLDLAAMVTELAPGNALAQRAGRVNRRGSRTRGPVTVVVPTEQIDDRVRSGPYGPDELRKALTWVWERAVAPDGLAPWALRGNPPPPAALPRERLQRPELAQAWHWARTSDDLAAAPELELWLADDFQDDVGVGVVVRERMPRDSADAIRFLTDLPPRPHEVFPARRRTLLAALANLPGEPTDSTERLPTMVRIRGDEVSVVERPASNSDDRNTWLSYARQLRPGDLLIVDTTTTLFSAGLPSVKGQTNGHVPPIVAVTGRLDGDDVENVGTAQDVLMAEADLQSWSNDRQLGRVVLRLEAGIGGTTDDALRALGDALADIDDDSDQDVDAQAIAVSGWLAAEAGRHPMTPAALRLLDEEQHLYQLTIHRDVDGEPHRVLLRDLRRAPLDEGLRQVWSRSGAISLAAHQAAVGSRAAVLADHLTIPKELVEALRLAGEHHDDGKADSRFQARLGRRESDPPLAKSRALTPAGALRKQRASGLPTGWRHEQRSVVDAWDGIHAADDVDADLVARLIGTSHGRGRVDFPHLADGLLPPEDAHLYDVARDLFDHGGWDSLIEQTQQRYGLWGCAYLEAVLRAADCQVSQEGS